MKRQMHLGLFILGTGSHVAGWRYPGAVDSFQDFAAIQEIGYQGWITIELYPYVENPDAAARTALERVNTVLASL